MGKSQDDIAEDETKRLQRRLNDTASIMRNQALNSSYMQDLDSGRSSSLPKEFISYRKKADENPYTR